MTTNSGEPQAHLPGSQPVQQDHPNGNDPAVVEPNTDPAAPAAAPTPEGSEAAQPVVESHQELMKRKGFKDDKRNAIFTKRNNMTLEEREAFRAEDPEQSDLSDTIAGFAPTPEESAVARAAAPPAAAPAVPGSSAAPAPAAQAPVATPTGKAYKLIIHGREAGEVSEEQVIQAGVAALQKQHSGDETLRQAATRTAQLVEYEAKLQRIADNLAKGLDPEGRPINPAGSPGPGQPPTTGVAGAIDKAMFAKATEALVRGDDAVGTDLLVQAVMDAVNRGRVEPATAPRTVEVPSLPQVVTSGSWSDAQLQSAKRIANDEFGDFDDERWGVLQQKMGAALNDPANAGKDISFLVMKAGNEARRAHVTPAVQVIPVDPVQQQLDARGAVKARIPVTPPPTSARVPPAAPTGPSIPSNKDYVHSLRVKSGSNSAPRR